MQLRCTFPKTVGFKADGKTLAWSQKDYSKEFATFQLPCGKCIECRLDYARQWAVRCVHESQMYEKNSFVTLTYSDENLKSPFLIYSDFQKFMKKLRKTQTAPMGCFVTGEYGDKTKRPHWHAILFNYEPSDSTVKYTTERGDVVRDSSSLTAIWGHGIAEYGSVTVDSAGYCARYAAKKLAHGDDGEHPYKPISKKSSKHAIGKTWLEKFWPDVFIRGAVILEGGAKCGIPRYYERWLKQNRPDDWLTYVTRTKSEKISLAIARDNKEKRLYWENHNSRQSRDWRSPTQLTASQVRNIITLATFKQLQSNSKL